MAQGDMNSKFKNVQNTRKPQITPPPFLKKAATYNLQIKSPCV